VLEVKQLNFSYADKSILTEIDFSLQQGHHLALIGKSGTGKSTLLSLINGNLQPNKGEIYWNKQKIFNPNHQLVAEHDNIKYLTQEFNVMPYTTVSENIKEHLSRMYPEKNESICKRLLNVVELENFSNVKVKKLSGGQKQRVALAKVLAKKPELLLLDEPFSHIDVFLRNQLRRKLFSYLKEENITCIFATHDPDDFLSYADKCLILDNAKIHDFRPMIEVYNQPKSQLTALLMGEVNCLSSELLQLESNNCSEIFLIYPNEIYLSRQASVEVKIKNNFFKGSHFLIEAMLGSKKMFFSHSSALPKNSLAKVEFNFPKEKRKLIIDSDCIT